MTDQTYAQLASAILVAHQRHLIPAGCLCGPLPLGTSWADHVAEVLDAAGALQRRSTQP